MQNYPYSISEPPKPPSKFGAMVGGAIKKIDRFGYPITMTYNNEQTYKSVFGGTMTIISVMALIAFLGVGIQKAVTQSKYSTTFAHRIRNVYLENNVIPLTENNFDYAV